MSILARRIETEFGYWIFPSMKKPGKHIPRVNGLHDKVLAKGAAAGKPLHFVLYDLRHTWATAQAGIDLATLAQILGHSGLRVVRSPHRRTPQGGNDAIRAEHDHAGGYQAVKKLPAFCPPVAATRAKLAYPDATNVGTRRETQWIQQKH